MADVSIITVCKNAERWLSDCIDSVATQTVDVEHILIDGGSADGTMDIVNARTAHFSHIVSEPDNGIYDAMNKGITLASSPVIGILNSDDEYTSDKVLSKVLDSLSSSQADACFGDLVYVDPNRNNSVVRYWRAGEFDRKKFLNGWMMPHPTLFLKRTAYQEFGLFNEGLGTSADYELMLRFFMKHGLSAEYLPEALVRMSVGGASGKSVRARWRANQTDRLAWKHNGLKPRYWTLYAKPLRKLPQWWVGKGHKLA